MKPKTHARSKTVEETMRKGRKAFHGALGTERIHVFVDDQQFEALESVDHEFRVISPSSIEFNPGYVP